MRGSSPLSCGLPSPVWAFETASGKASGGTLAVTVGALLGLAAGLGLWAALVVAGWAAESALKVAAVTAGHGALLSASLGWAAAARSVWKCEAAGRATPEASLRRWKCEAAGRATPEASLRWKCEAAGRATPEASREWGFIAGPALVAIALLALGAVCAAVGPGGAVAHLVLPAWLLLVARCGRLAALGVRRPAPAASMLGAALGGHLLLSATLTLGYRVRQDGLGTYLAALAYDVGANVPSSELFFRGVLFDQIQRRWSFLAGAAIATAAYLLRFLLDPRLPGTTEALVGGVVYLSLLSFGNCWLFWWSGSLMPALASALVFFTAYRMLAVG
jgi:hypothetical protein